jgi:hypothetical protein
MRLRFGLGSLRCFSKVPAGTIAKEFGVEAFRSIDIDCCREEISGSFFCFGLHAYRFVFGYSDRIGCVVAHWNGSGFGPISSQVGVHGRWFYYQ